MNPVLTVLFFVIGFILVIKIITYKVSTGRFYPVIEPKTASSVFFLFASLGALLAIILAVVNEWTK